MFEMCSMVETWSARILAKSPPPSPWRATIERFAAGLSWPLPEQLTDAVLEAALYPDKGAGGATVGHVEPDWAMIHRELKRKHVTLSILVGRVHRAAPGRDTATAASANCIGRGRASCR
jgi:hypothetical protein